MACRHVSGVLEKEVNQESKKLAAQGLSLLESLIAKVSGTGAILSRPQLHHCARSLQNLMCLNSWGMGRRTFVCGGDGFFWCFFFFPKDA